MRPLSIACRPRSLSIVRIGIVIGATCLGVGASEPADLRERIKDSHAAGSDWWVYNNLPAAFQAARASGKPLFVTFRCVPCEACSSFDAEVAQGNEAVRRLAQDAFIAVRQVEMKGVDLSQFQFDYDLNWAAMFLHADGTVFARYGTQSADGPDATNSIQGLQATMRRVLEFHAAYPDNADEFKAKRGDPKPYPTPLEMPGLEQAEQRRGLTTRRNCIHCHNIHDAEHRHAYAQGTFARDMLWRYPLPDLLGITIDPDSGVEIARIADNSAAARAGLVAGERLTHMDGQAIASIADMQWVLHSLSNRGATLNVRGSQSGLRTLRLDGGWKEHDISWRGSMWSLRPRLRVWTPPASDAWRSEHAIDPSHAAFEARWINRQEPGGKAAWAGGLREGDVIVKLDGQPIADMTPSQFQLKIKFDYAVGDEIEVGVIRKGEARTLRIALVE